MNRLKTLVPLLAALAVLATLLWFSAASTEGVIRESERLRLADRMARAELLAEQVDTNVLGAAEFLQRSFGRTPFRLTPDDPEDLAVLRPFAAGVAPLTLSTAEGDVRSSAPGRGTVPPPTNPVYRELAARMAAGTPVATITDENKLGVSMYVMRQAEPVGILTLWLSITIEKSPLLISAPLAKSKAGGLSGVVVVDSRNVVVGGDTAGRVGQKVPDLAVWRQATTGKGHAEYKENGTTRVMVWAQAPKTLYGLALVEDAGDFYGTVQRDQRRSNLASLAVLAAAAVALAIFGHRRQRALADSETRLSALLGNAADAIVVVRHGRVAYASPGTTRVLGRAPGDLMGAHVEEVLSGPDLVQLCERALLAGGQMVRAQVSRVADDGTTRWVSVSAVDLHDDASVNGVILTCHDITEQKLLHEQVAHQALHDGLTGLPNRTLFTTRLNGALRRRRRQGSHVGVLFLDLDGFKPVNDRMGHEAGDAVLREVAARLQAAVRDGDTIARMGGDEFAVVVEDATSPDDFPELARRLITSLETPIAIGAESVRVGVSIGIAVAEPGDRVGDSLLRDADLAMYTAKDGGGDSFHVYDPACMPSKPA